MNETRTQALVDYEGAYVQPLIVSALKRNVPPEVFEILETGTFASRDKGRALFQWRSYEALDFEQALEATSTQLINAYIIRKALIRKHYLSHTVHSWVVKHPESALKRHFKAAEDFELDYAEFLDDALVEAFDLRKALDQNQGLAPAERQWWILKPGMSDRGQGIRLFSTETELSTIFEDWEADEPASEDEDASDDGNSTNATNGKSLTEGIVTSHLRHFVAQPYIHPPLLAAQAPFSNRKFHIRTYVVASGALSVYVYEHMLALFASEAYMAPWESSGASDNDDSEANELLQRMRNVHLSNTCVQTASSEQKAQSVFLLDDLPFSASTITTMKQQIRETTSELFRAALAQPVNFQALPQSFEVFGLDFLVSAHPTNVWLLEVNAFPDFAQTGEALRDKVVQGLFDEVVRWIVCPRFGVAMAETPGSTRNLLEVLDADTGLR